MTTSQQPGNPDASPVAGAPVFYPMLIAPRPFPLLASWGARAAACLIDEVPATLTQIAALVFAFRTTEVVLYDAREDFAIWGISERGWLVLGISALVSWSYRIWNRGFRQGRTGRSLGKSVMRISLVSQRTLRPVGAAVSFGRELWHLADALTWLGYLWPLCNDARQTFADLLMRTVVIKD